jgi:tRNA-dihydrouridine synthase A
MLDWTDRHCRYFLRRITRRTLLYTEMITTGALLHRDPGDFLDFDPDERPLALQLGGSVPDEHARCSGLAATWGYDEVNLNVGCPSDRVRNGRFGACLMADPGLVADGVAAMTEASPLPVTVKHRIGIDDRDSYDELAHFVATVADAGCRTFVVHARKAWLAGLSPRENREIPPLQYATVHRLKRDFPTLEIVLNGGIRSLDEVDEHRALVDGVMIGREAYQNPWLLADADRRVFGDDHGMPTRRDVAEQMLDYIDRWQAAGTPLHRITRHMLGLFHGQPRARAWRRELSENARAPGVDSDLVRRALAIVAPRG